MEQRTGPSGSCKVVLDVAVALGGDCLAGVAVLRGEPGLFGPVASDPTVSWLIDTLAGGGDRVLKALHRACADVRQRVWMLAGGWLEIGRRHLLRIAQLALDQPASWGANAVARGAGARMGPLLTGDEERARVEVTDGEGGEPGFGCRGPARRAGGGR